MVGETVVDDGPDAPRVVGEDRPELLADLHGALGDPAEPQRLKVSHAVIGQVGVSRRDLVLGGLHVPRPLEEAEVPHLVAVLQVDVDVWREALLHQQRKLVNVVGRGVHGDVDPDVLAGQVGDSDHIFPGHPVDAGVEMAVKRPVPRQGPVRRPFEPIRVDLRRGRVGVIVGPQHPHEAQRAPRVACQGLEPEAGEHGVRARIGAQQMHVRHARSRRVRRLPARLGETQLKKDAAGRIADQHLRRRGVGRGVVVLSADARTLRAQRGEAPEREPVGAAEVRGAPQRVHVHGPRHPGERVAVVLEEPEVALRPPPRVAHGGGVEAGRRLDQVHVGLLVGVQVQPNGGAAMRPRTGGRRAAPRQD